MKPAYLERGGTWWLDWGNNFTLTSGCTKANYCMQSISCK
jgi:hypothetical protein